MAYLQVDDRFPDHPKIVILSDCAFRAHVSALCYCSEHLTDGVLPKTVGDRLARPKARKELLCGLWTEIPGGYSIHDYLDWNSSREEVLARIASKREAGAKGGAASAATRSLRSKQRAQGVERSGEGSASGVGGSGEGVEAFDRFWAAYPVHVAKKAARKKFAEALKTGTDADAIIAGAERYRDDPNRHATAHPTTWLNQGRWEDGPLPVWDQDRVKPSVADQAARLLEAS